MAVALVLSGAGGAVFVWRDATLRRASLDRLDENIRERAAVSHRSGELPFPPRYPWVSAAAGAAAGVLAILVFGATAPFALAFGSMAAALAWLAETTVAERRVATIEGQLADAIDLMVGALRSGASVLSALEATVREIAPPLQPRLDRVISRIRLGDDPSILLHELARSVPLEVFRLFATSLAVHWEAGGSLSTTLATVGRTIRDRIELGRRVRAQSVESRLSSVGVLGIAYAIAFIAWQSNPGPVEMFLSSSIGSVIAACAIALQSIGLVWMERLSRIDF